MGSPLRAFQWDQYKHHTLVLSPQRVAQKRKGSKIRTVSCDNSETVRNRMWLPLISFLEFVSLTFIISFAESRDLRMLVSIYCSGVPTLRSRHWLQQAWARASFSSFGPCFVGDDWKKVVNYWGKKCTFPEKILTTPVNLPTPGKNPAGAHHGCRYHRL